MATILLVSFNVLVAEYGLGILLGILFLLSVAVSAERKRKKDLN